MVADEDFIGNIDKVNHGAERVTNSEGIIRFPALIPGAQYRFTNYLDGKPIVTDFIAKSGEIHDMGTIVLERNE